MQIPTAENKWRRDLTTHSTICLVQDIWNSLIAYLIVSQSISGLLGVSHVTKLAFEAMSNLFILY